MDRVARPPPPSGVLVVDKPRGPTSHDVVAKVRRALGTREVGHAGTLDPMATGVLVVAVGEATKLVPWLTAHAKSYRATIRLGVETSSLDAEGDIVATREIGPRLRDALSTIAAGGRDAFLEAALDVERARTSQVPPVVSAIKVAGVASHARARRGEVIDLPARAVAVERLAITAARVEPPELDVEIDCAKGYYVRALSRDLASGLDTVAHLVALRRTRSGPFRLEDAVALDAVSPERLIPLAAAAARAIGTSALTEEGAIRAGHGKRLTAAEFEAAPREGVSAWLHGERLVAVGEIVEGVGRVVRGFRAE